MDCSNRNDLTDFCEPAEEGEIREDDNSGVGFAYDSVSSDSFSASNNSKETFLVADGSQLPFHSENEELKTDKYCKKPIWESDKSKNNVTIMHKRRNNIITSAISNNYINHQVDRSKRDRDNIIQKDTAHRTKLPNELNSQKSSGVFVTIETRHSHSQTSAGKSLNQENLSHNQSKASEKVKVSSRKSCKKMKRKKHSSRCSSDYHSHDSSSSRRKSRQEKNFKYHKDKVHKHHLQSDSDSDVHEINSSKRHPHSFSHRTKPVDPTCRSFLKDSVQKKKMDKVLEREPEVMTSEKFNRFKDNILMRKLLESGTIRSRRDSGGSDLNCEIGSISTISSPELELFEDLDLSEDNSLGSAPTIKNDVISDDSEIEVIIPVKKQPELIDLKSESDSEMEKPNDVPSNNESLNISSTIENVTSNDQLDSSECVNLDSPPHLVEDEGNPSIATVTEGKEKCEEEATVSEVNLENQNSTTILERENESEVGNTSTENNTKEQPITIANPSDDEDDLQLRLDALKSAVIKKHHERLKKRSTLKSVYSDVSKIVGEDKNQGSTFVVENLKNVNEGKDDSIKNSNKSFHLQENAQYDDKRSPSPYSPASDYSLPLGEENDNNVEEQDMEIDGTDEEETCLLLDGGVKSVPTSFCQDNFQGLVNKVPSDRPEVQENFKSFDFSSKLLSMEVHSSENTLDSVEPSKNINFTEIPAQPLPPGVELSNLPPEFNYALCVSRESVYNVSTDEIKVSSFCNKLDSVETSHHPFPQNISDMHSLNSTCLPPLNNELMSTESCNAGLKQGYLTNSSNYFENSHLNFVHSNQSLNKKENNDCCCNSSQFGQQYDNEDIQCQVLCSPAGDGEVLCNPVNDVSRDAKELCNITYSVELKKDMIIRDDLKENRIYQSVDCHQVGGDHEALSRTSLNSQDTKLECVKLQKKNEVPYFAETDGKTLCTQNYFRSVNTSSTHSEKSRDSFQDDDNENVLRANLLTSLGNFNVKSVSNENLSVKPGKTKFFKKKQKLNFRKRLVVGRKLNQNSLSSSFSDSGSLQYNLPRKKFRESLQITLPGIGNKVCNSQKSTAKKRQVIPVNSLKNHNSKFIIKVGEDSDSAEEHDFKVQRNISSNSDGEDWLRRVSIRDNCAELVKNAIKNVTDNCPPELEKSVDLLVKQVRKQHELKSRTDSSLTLNKNNSRLDILKTIPRANYAINEKIIKPANKQDNLTPLAVRHLPKSQQEEYRRLKQQILEKERLKQLQLIDKQQQSLNLPVTIDVNQTDPLRLMPVKIVPNENKSSRAPSSRDNSENVCCNCIQRIVPTSLSQNRETWIKLTELEETLITERYNVLDNILEVELFLRKYDQNLEQYNSASREVSALREKLTEAESRLENCTKILDVAKKGVITSHKKLRSCRMKYSQSEKSCNEEGKHIVGDKYKLPRVAAELVTKKFDEILRTSKKYLWSSDLVNESVDNSSLTEMSNQQVNINKRQLDDVPLSANDSQQSKRTKLIDAKNPEVSIRTEETSLYSEKVSENQLLPYVSPLAHLHGGLSRNHLSAGNSNHDAILCPYDLRGSCMDDACPYQH